MKLTILGVVAAGFGFLGALAFQSQPHATQLSEPLYGLDLVPYVTVERTDGTYRRMLIERGMLSIIQSSDTQTIPDGTRILMETYYSPGNVSTVFHKKKVDGRWQYGSFSSSSPNLDVRPQASCLSCHARTSDTDFTFTAPSFWAFALDGVEDRFTCDRGGRRPCTNDVYREGAAQ